MHIHLSIFYVQYSLLYCMLLWPVGRYCGHLFCCFLGGSANVVVWARAGWGKDCITCGSQTRKPRIVCQLASSCSQLWMPDRYVQCTLACSSQVQRWLFTKEDGHSSLSKQGARQTPGPSSGQYAVFVVISSWSNQAWLEPLQYAILEARNSHIASWRHTGSLKACSRVLNPEAYFIAALSARLLPKDKASTLGISAGLLVWQGLSSLAAAVIPFEKGRPLPLLISFLLSSAGIVLLRFVIQLQSKGWSLLCNSQIKYKEAPIIQSDYLLVLLLFLLFL